jgi:fibronectin-binding autotransporter adhesin
VHRLTRSTASSLLAFVVTLAALGAPAPQVAQAAPSTYLVDRTDDVIVAACTNAPNDCSLRGAVQDANANPGSTIVLAAQQTYLLTNVGAGELILTANTAITTSQALCITNCIAVIAGGPGWATRLLKVVPGAAVSVDHVEFTGGNANNGGALLNSGTLTLTTSQIFSNTVGGWGGGILNYGTLTISNTVINGNKAVVTGGAIVNQADIGQPGAVTIINSRIITNSATGTIGGQGGGGGITSFNNISQTIHPQLTLINTSLLTNTGTTAGYGGGLYVDGNTTLTNVTLQGNSASGGGGAYVHFGQLTMQGGQVVSNTALTGSGSGGGFRNDGLLTLNGVLASGNQTLGGGSGGAISSSSPFTVTNSTLTKNSSDSGGGAIWLAGPSALLLLNHSNLISNTSTYGAGVGGYGTYTVTNGSLISGNSAFQGGGLNIVAGGRAWIGGNSQIANNQTLGGAPGTSYGAGIYNNGLLQIQSATLGGNAAGNGSGGGLYNDTGGQASLASAAVVSNMAQAGPGGGISNLGILTITASAIVSNTTIASGGGISNTGTLSVLNTTFSGNSAASSGGGLFNNGQARLNFVTVAMNSASAAGGLAATSALTLSNTLLGDNTGAPPDCSGAVTSLSHNLIADTTGCTLLGPDTGDKRNVVPLITGLIDQGGALRFHDLQHLSPALDAADPAGGACPATDQRGVVRPIGPHCDIGAVESSAAYFYVFLPLAVK